MKMSARQSGGGGDGDIDMVALPDAVYVKLPAEQAIQPGKPWLKIDPNGTDPASRAIAPALEEIQKASDPLSTLIKAGKTSIVSSGDESVDGKPAARYELRVDLTQGATDPSAGAPFKQLGVDTLQPTVWLDAQDRLLRFELTVSSPGGTAKVAASARYSGWGEPVDIAPPPAEQVTSLPG